MRSGIPFIEGDNVLYLVKGTGGYFPFCDNQHKTLCDTFFSRINERNRSPSQNYSLINRTKSVLI